jgi:hypothetical protein
MDVLKNSQEIKKQADLVLQTYDLVKKLCKFGKVEVIGSHKLDLMWQKDIDICIQNEIHPNFSQLTDLIKDTFVNDDFYYFKIEDNTKLIKPNFPKGVGMFLKLNSGWKFDLWFITAEESKKKESMIEELFQKYKPNMQEEILKYKKLAIEQGVYNKEFNSLDLYKAVIEGNLEGIDKYLHRK